MKKIQRESFCLPLWNHLLIVKIIPVTLFRCGDFDHENAYRNPPVVRKYHTESGLGHEQLRGFFLHPIRGGHRRKPAKDREGSKFRNYDAASGTIFRISTCFQRSKERLHIYFLLNKAVKKFKNHLRMYRKYWFNFVGLKEIFIGWPDPFNGFMPFNVWWSL